jgi:hypothetical protein
MVIALACHSGPLLSSIGPFETPTPPHEQRISDGSVHPGAHRLAVPVEIDLRALHVPGAHAMALVDEVFGYHGSAQSQRHAIQDGVDVADEVTPFGRRQPGGFAESHTRSVIGVVVQVGEAAFGAGRPLSRCDAHLLFRSQEGALDRTAVNFPVGHDERGFPAHQKARQLVHFMAGDVEREARVATDERGHTGQDNRPQDGRKGRDAHGAHEFFGLAAPAHDNLGLSVLPRPARAGAGALPTA